MKNLLAKIRQTTAITEDFTIISDAQFAYMNEYQAYSHGLLDLEGGRGMLLVRMPHVIDGVVTFRTLRRNGTVWYEKKKRFDRATLEKFDKSDGRTPSS